MMVRFHEMLSLCAECPKPPGKREISDMNEEHAIGKPLLDQREKRKKVLWSVLHGRCQRKVNGTVLVWVWRVTENPVLKSLRKLYADGWDLQEDLERRAQQVVVGEFFNSEKITLDWVQHGDPKLGTKKFIIRIFWIATRVWISKTPIIGRYLMDRSRSTWENTFGSELKMKYRLHQESYARSCQEFEELRKKLLSRGKYWKTTKAGRISCAAWSGITNSESVEGSATKIKRTIGIDWRLKNLLWSWLTEQLGQ